VPRRRPGHVGPARQPPVPAASDQAAQPPEDGRNPREASLLVSRHPPPSRRTGPFPPTP
jgi:hypothetical protein